MRGEHQRSRLHPRQTQTIAVATPALLHRGCRSRSTPQAREGCTAEALISGGFLYSNLATFRTHRRRRRDSRYDRTHSYAAVRRKETVPGYRLAAMECKETLTTHAEAVLAYGCVLYILVHFKSAERRLTLWQTWS